jgi:hypothetical protein
VGEDGTDDAAVAGKSDSDVGIIDISIASIKVDDDKEVQVSNLLEDDAAGYAIKTGTTITCEPTAAFSWIKFEGDTDTIANVAVKAFASWSCNKCLKPMHTSDSTSGCRECDYDVCVSCINQCPNNSDHKLLESITSGKKSTGKGNAECNECHLNPPVGSTVYSCRTCNYDRCLQCHTTCPYEHHILKPYKGTNPAAFAVGWKFGGLCTPSAPLQFPIDEDSPCFLNRVVPATTLKWKVARDAVEGVEAWFKLVKAELVRRTTEYDVGVKDRQQRLITSIAHASAKTIANRKAAEEAAVTAVLATSEGTVGNESRLTGSEAEQEGSNLLWDFHERECTESDLFLTSISKVMSTVDTTSGLNHMELKSFDEWTTAANVEMQNSTLMHTKRFQKRKTAFEKDCKVKEAIDNALEKDLAANAALAKGAYKRKTTIATAQAKVAYAADVAARKEAYAKTTGAMFETYEAEVAIREELHKTTAADNLQKYDARSTVDAESHKISMAEKRQMYEADVATCKEDYDLTREHNQRTYEVNEAAPDALKRCNADNAALKELYDTTVAGKKQTYDAEVAFEASMYTEQLEETSKAYAEKVKAAVKEHETEIADLLESYTAGKDNEETVYVGQLEAIQRANAAANSARTNPVTLAKDAAEMYASMYFFNDKRGVENLRRVQAFHAAESPGDLAQIAQKLSAGNVEAVLQMPETTHTTRYAAIQLVIDTNSGKELELTRLACEKVKKGVLIEGKFELVVSAGLSAMVTKAPMRTAVNDQTLTFTNSNGFLWKPVPTSLWGRSLRDARMKIGGEDSRQARLVPVSSANNDLKIIQRDPVFACPGRHDLKEFVAERAGDVKRDLEWRCNICKETSKDETHTIRLNQRNGMKLGVVFGGATNAATGVPILHVTKGGQAAGQLAKGDEVIAVNGNSVLGMTKEQSASVIAHNDQPLFTLSESSPSALKTTRKAGQMFGCRECNYDVCESCRSTCTRPETCPAMHELVQEEDVNASKRGAIRRQLVSVIGLVADQSAAERIAGVHAAMDQIGNTTTCKYSMMCPPPISLTRSMDLQSLNHPIAHSTHPSTPAPIVSFVDSFQQVHV